MENKLKNVVIIFQLLIQKTEHIKYYIDILKEFHVKKLSKK